MLVAAAFSAGCRARGTRVIRLAVPSRDRLVTLWLFTVTALVLAMVAVGGYTRLTRSGLSIVEWNPVAGALPPLSDAEWDAAFSAYRLSPEGRLINAGIDLVAFKSIFIVEWFHRLLGRFVGAVFLIPWCFFVARRWLPGAVAARYLLWFTLGGLQGALGWFMVKSGLSDAPHVSPYRLTAHLGLALVVCAALWLEVLHRQSPFSSRAPAEMPRRLTVGLVALVLVTIGWGGLMAGHKAGWLSDTFPLMGGQWVPFGVEALGPGSVVTEPMVVHFFHRVLGLSTLAFTVWVFLRSRSATAFERRAAVVSLGLSLFQVGLGIATVVLHVPIVVAVLHQLNGALLLLAAVSLAAVPSKVKDLERAADAVPVLT